VNSSFARYLKRVPRGLRLLDELGRSSAFRLENRISVAKLDYPARDVYLRLDSRYAPGRIRACAKEPFTVAWLERWLRPGEVLYDVGANVGPYALLAASLHGSDVQVVAIEPAYATFAALCDNIVLNELGDRVFPLNVVLGADTELGTLNYRDLEPGAGMHSTGNRGFLEGPYEPAYRQPVLTYGLDDLLSRFPLPRPNHLKLDVDGSELDVLAGATQLLTSADLRTVMIEINQREAEQTVSLLVGRGLTLHERYDSPAGDHWYGLFARRDAAP
jgi:FkbM family methyltransferase